MARPIDQIKEMLAQPDAKVFVPILPGHASVYIHAADRESAVGALHEINLAIRERRLVLDELVSVQPLTSSLLPN